jgi:asparagine synthase (glutamine-hydrolysing)
MCGIFGYIACREGIDIVSATHARDTMYHRGPDAYGVWLSDDRSVGLFHRRLAILDLTEAGAQPMASEDNSLIITFNGEIYNHNELRAELKLLGLHFRGHSDTEVILAAYSAWGRDCLQKLRGMFAFGIWDRTKSILFLARDRAGEKPLYWAKYDDGIVFASELKAILSLPKIDRELDLIGLNAYLSYGYVPGDRCLIYGAKKIRPGHWLEISMEPLEFNGARYWNLPEFKPISNSSEDELANELRGLLSSAVREQLQADVPVAVLLSGGTDSSIITALSAEVSSAPIKTYTVGFPGNDSHDERHYARRIATFFNTDHTEISIDNSHFEILPQLAHHFDEPIADSSMIPTFLLTQVIAQHDKVVVGGDGADELFGGYRAYQGAVKQETLRNSLPTWLRNPAAKLAEALLPLGYKNRNGLIGLGGTIQDSVANMGVMFDWRHRIKLIPELSSIKRYDECFSWKHGLVEASRGIPGSFMAADFMTYLPEDILVKVDRASMANSLELRAPFLDNRVIEFAFRNVPNSLRANTNERKILLKRLAGMLLPPDFDSGRKQGFSIPLTKWLTIDYCLSCFEDFNNHYPGFFSRQYLMTLVNSPSLGSSTRLFSIIILMLWMQSYKISLPSNSQASI